MVEKMIDTEHGSVVVHDRNDFLIRRTTNTVSVPLEADEVFALIRDLAAGMELGGPVYLVVESDKIYAKDME